MAEDMAMCTWYGAYLHGRVDGAASADAKLEPAASDLLDLGEHKQVEEGRVHASLHGRDLALHGPLEDEPLGGTASLGLRVKDILLHQAPRYYLPAA
jgi:hypothetical protein